MRASWLPIRAVCLPVLLLAVLLAGLAASGWAQSQGSLGPPTWQAFLADAAQFRKAWTQLVEAVGARPVMRITVVPDRIAIVAEDPEGSGQLHEWSVTRRRLAGLFVRDSLSGPSPADLPRAVDDVRSGLFPLGDVAIGALEKLLPAAVARAGLEAPAQVTRIDIERQAVVMANPPRYGPLVWRLTVGSGRESATIYAAPGGRIVAADLSQTLRAERLDLLGSDDWPRLQAQAQLAEAIGDTARVRRLSIGRKSISVTFDDADPLDPQLRASWDLSGVRNATLVPMPNMARHTGFTNAPFRIADLNFGGLPEVRRAALQAMGGDGKITDISVEKSLSGAQGPELEWRVKVVVPSATPAKRFGPTMTFGGGDDEGVVHVRMDASVRHVVLPSRRPATVWTAPEALSSVLREVVRQFGSEARISEVRLGKYGASIVMEDPARAGQSMGLTMDDEGLRRSDQGTGGPLRKASFPLSALDSPGIDALPAIAADLDRRIALPDEPLFSISLYASEGHRTPRGSPMLEVWRNGQRQGILTYRFATGVITDVRW